MQNLVFLQEDMERPGTPQQKKLTLGPQHHINITVVAENNQSNINLSPSLSVSDRAVTNSLFTSSVLDLFLCIQLFSPGVRVKSELCLGVKWIIATAYRWKTSNSPTAEAQCVAATQKASGAEEKHVLMTNEEILCSSSWTPVGVVCNHIDPTNVTDSDLFSRKCLSAISIKCKPLSVFLDYKLCSLISVLLCRSYSETVIRKWNVQPGVMNGASTSGDACRYGTCVYRLQVHFCILHVIIRFSFRVWIKIVISGHANQTASIQLIKNPLDPHRSQLRHNILAIIMCAKAYL